jgi:hypothetical protein
MKGITLAISLFDKNEKAISIISFYRYFIKNGSHAKN